MQKLFDTVNFCTKPKLQDFVQCTFGTVYYISKVRLVVKTVELTLKRVSNEKGTRKSAGASERTKTKTLDRW